MTYILSRHEDFLNLLFHILEVLFLLTLISRHFSELLLKQFDNR
jgi:hypothetical protein